MKCTRVLMGMPITIEVCDAHASQRIIEDVFDYFHYVDETFSPYKETSEISAINAGTRSIQDASNDMREVLELSEQTKQETGGFFDIRHGGLLDPSGLVKGWSILKSAELLHAKGYQNFYVEAGGDIQVEGCNAHGEPWRIGIRNPFNHNEIVKVVELSHNEGIATSGTSMRGQHIYNPHQPNEPIEDIMSITVIAKNVYEADRFATAAFARGKEGIHCIEDRDALEGYMIDANGIATMTRGFHQYESMKEL